MARKRDTEDVILEAALNLLRRYGYERVSMNDLAREAGISRATLYLRYSSKEQVALAVVDRMYGRLLERLTAIAGSPAPPADRIREMLVERVLFLFDAVSDLGVSLDEVYRRIRPPFLERRDRFDEAAAAVLAGVFREGVDAGDFAPRDPLRVARTLIACTNGILPYSLSPREMGRRDEIAEIVGTGAGLLVRGLEARRKDTGDGEPAESPEDSRK
jgi:AcrR family transcriptional regulator